MTDPINDTIAIASAEERLRQERETFDQIKEQDARSFAVRQAMSWMAVVLLPVFAVTCGWIIFHHDQFTTAEVTVATSALLGDILGLLISIWKIILRSSPRPLGPVTEQNGTKTPGNRRRAVSAKNP